MPHWQVPFAQLPEQHSSDELQWCPVPAQGAGAQAPSVHVTVQHCAAEAHGSPTWVHPVGAHRPPTQA